MELLYILLVLLTAARVAGEVAIRLGQPALLGELLAGVGLGVLATRHSDALPVLADKS
jgi:Kef-type K+ transport system membrane component KefB